MSVTYLLPCRCGKAVEITTAEAGRMVDCPCGEQLQVPKLREIQQLPRRQEQSAEKRPVWSVQQGVLFSIGLVLFSGSLGIIGWLIYQHRQLDTQPIVIKQETIDINHQKVMDLEAFQALHWWNTVWSQPLDKERILPPSEVNRAAARIIVWKTVAAGVVAFVGLCLMGVSAVLRKPKAASNKRKDSNPKPA